MNRIFRLVWNPILNVWVAAAETARGHGKGSASRPLVAASLALTGFAFFVPLAQAGPEGGQVSAGSGTITQASLVTTINQTSQNMAIDWQSFGLGANESVRFHQPNASAIALNRVLGQSPSQILGEVSANGQVFVLNPNGVLFGAGSQVNVGGLVASTLGMSNADFMAGEHSFRQESNSTGSASNTGTASAANVVNQGRLTAAQGGYIALLAPEVRNEGIISATLGTALLAAGDKVTLSLNNGSLLGYSIDQGAVSALAENRQLIQADGGRVILSARALDALASATVNNTGIVEAKTLNNTAGRILLSGDMDVGQAFQLGTLNVSAPGSGDAGSVRISAAAVLDAGQIRASSVSGLGGQIALTATGGLVQTAQASVDANGAAGGGDIALLGNNVFSSASLQAVGMVGMVGTGPGANGGSIDVLARNQVVLAAADLDASARAGVDAAAGGRGGRIRIGGDFQGANPLVVNAATTIVNGAARLRANGGSDADGGSVIVWSEDLTRYHGQIEAKGGEVEVSSRNTLQFSGDVTAKTLLLDPKNITISAASGPAAHELIDPNAAAGRNFGSNATVLGITTGGVFTPSNRLVIGVGDDNGNRGAVYLYDTTSGALISSLVGSTANDYVGISGVTALSNGNYVVSSTNWRNGTVANAGAVTWGSGSTGVSGVVSSSNSLVGSTANDAVGNYGVTVLSHGNYVVSSSNWDSGTVANAGAVTWGSGSTGVSGAVSSSNSLVGSTANDYVGNYGITALSNGNYVVASGNWNNGGTAAYAGAATWGSGTVGVSGAVSSSNSLVGSTANDYVGISGVTALSNGNYVVVSTNWDNGTVVNAGAVTWGGGTSGVSGVVSSSNSLVGSTTNDRVGDYGVTALSNGNYVVVSATWDNGTVANAGAVTWGSGTTGVSGLVSSSNSLVGSTANDTVGNYDVTALSNGNYVVASANWDNGTVGNAGAVTWGSGTAGVSGAISSSNSLVGSTANDYVGISGVTALSNGNYVVASSNWDNGTVVNAGAVTWGSGTGGLSGAVSSSNSLVGSTANDAVGNYGVTALSNGNYVVASPYWNNGSTAAFAGAVTWGSGTTGVSGAVSSSNSLVGSSASDIVGDSGITALSNGNYVVANPYWDSGTVSNAGAVTWGSGTSGVSGAVGSSNSLVGSTANDNVGSNGTTALSDGNYVVSSGNWGNGSAAYAGAVTWGSGTSGASGAVSSLNSLVGSMANDSLGNEGITALSDGNYLVRSSYVNGSRGQVLIGSPGSLAFATASGQSLSFNPDTLTTLLATGTAVTLQASNDITVASAIDVAGSSGGSLTLQAGRSILFNANVTSANGDLTAVANDAGAISTQREAGSGDIVIASGVTLNVGTGTANLAGQRFINNSGAAAVNTSGAGRWLVWTDNPDGDNAGALSPSFRQYAASYGGAPAQANGNGFLYRSADPAAAGTGNGSTPTSGSILAADMTAGYDAAMQQVSGSVQPTRWASNPGPTAFQGKAEAGAQKTSLIGCGVSLPASVAENVCQ